MRKRELTLPELLFIIGTRAMLASGVAMLISRLLSDRQRKSVGTTLIAIGAVTTVPAAMLVLGGRNRVPEKIEPYTEPEEAPV